MAEFNDAEAREAAKALVQWFNALGLTPKQSRIVMAKVTAKSMLAASTDFVELQRQITLFATEVSHEVARQARGVSRG